MGGSEGQSRFAAFVGDAARRAGYDIDGPRGDRARLARDSGMTPSSVGRMLSGDSIPDPRFFEPLAHALHVHVRDLFIESGIISPETLAGYQSPQVRSRITPEEAADRLGLTDPIDRELFLGAVDRLRTRARARGSDEGGAAVDG